MLHSKRYADLHEALWDKGYNVYLTFNNTPEPTENNLAIVSRRDKRELSDRDVTVLDELLNRYIVTWKPEMSSDDKRFMYWIW